MYKNKKKNGLKLEGADFGYNDSDIVWIEIETNRGAKSYIPLPRAKQNISLNHQIW